MKRNIRQDIPAVPGETDFYQFKYETLTKLNRKAAKSRKIKRQIKQNSKRQA